MSTLYADTFDRADTSPGAGLGTTDTGSLAWTTITGTAWQIKNNEAYTSDDRSTNPLCVVDPSSANVDVSANVGRGDCLYFRVVDADNWWRVRQSAVSSSGTSVGSWSAWSDWSADIYGCGRTSSNCVAGYSGYVSGYATVNTQCRASIGPCSYMDADRKQTRTVYSYSSTSYTLTLEKCVAGVVTEVGGDSRSSTSQFRVVALGDTIEWFRYSGSNWVSVETVSDSTHGTATQHGVGRGSSSSNSNDLKAFSVTVLAPPTPTTVTPLSAATTSTDVPVLGVTLVEDTVATITQKAEWQLATDAGFTSNVRTVTEGDEDQRSLGPTTETVPDNQALFQGTWYIRSRSLLPGGEAQSSYTSSHTFTVSHPPAAASLFPTNGASTVSQGGAAFLSWVFTDTSPVDAQVAYEVEIERTSDNASVANTGKIYTSATNASVPIDSQYVGGVELQWRIRLYDRDDVAGSWSSWSQFIVVFAPEVSIIQPADGSTVISPAPATSWSYSGDLPQGAWKVRYERTGAVLVHDTGWQTGSALVYSPPPVYENGISYTVSVTVRDADGHESLTATSEIDAIWTPPMTSVVYMWDYGDTLGYIDLQWDSILNDPEFVTWQVYRRPAGVTDWTLLYTTFEVLVSGFYEYKDYTARSQVDYEYAVVQTAMRFGVEITSDFDVNEITTTSSHYWLIFEDDLTQSFRMPAVTAEKFTEEYERAEFNVIGRGRHVEIGERIGIRGDLTFQLRGDEYLGLTARDQLDLIMAAAARDATAMIRNPFGNIWSVNLGDVNYDRMPGVGLREFCTVTVPYLEVYD